MSASKWTASVSIWFVTTILFTYGTCLHQGHCGGTNPLWSGPWNSISHSWEEYPGNYVSRFVVGYCCPMVAVFHALLYVATSTADRKANAEGKRCCRCFTNEVLCGVGVFACFCLSWVGAICDADNDPQCMGNNTIHSTCAILFFFLTDVVAGVLACDPKTDKAKEPWQRFKSQVTFAVLLATTAVRVLRHPGVLGDGPSFQHFDNLTIIAEVLEVYFFVVFLNSIADAYLQGLSWAAIRGAPSDANQIQVLSAVQVASGASAMLLLTVLTSYAVSVHSGAVAPLPSVPKLGELFAAKPTNWFGRWGLVQASTYSVWVAIFSTAALTKGSSWALKDSILLLVQVSAALALACMGMVNMSEDAAVHATATTTFFACADASVLLTVLGSLLAHWRSPEEAAWAPHKALTALAAGVTVTGLRLLPMAHSCEHLAAASASLEWANLLLLAAFWPLNLALRPEAEAMALVMLVDAQPPAAAAKSKTASSGVAVSVGTIDLI